MATTVQNPFSDGIALIDGVFVPIADARIPILDWGFLRSDACQDTVSVCDGAFFRLDDHLARFERSWSRLRMSCPLSRGQIRSALHESIARTRFRDAYVQMIMTRGRAPIGSRDVRLAENRFWMFTIPYVWIATPEKKQTGLAMHISGIRRLPKETVDPTIKNYHWLDFQMALMESYDNEAETTVLVDGDGNLTEGPGFNIFVVKDGRLKTPPTDVCLDGMTRDTVMKLCAETNLTVDETAVTPDAARAADEVFITSTGGGVIPITRIDGTPVGPGQPGPVARRLDDLYWRKRREGWLSERVDYNAEPVWPDGW